ncbi:sensor histidine kinase [Nitratidesulfovibrio vulgaris]|uniref:histidine kinase n=2 Tax=Nitratidesulfovibrio vulgaris TaxID=881 RepID=Q72FS4_NITV2|nr:sensor histidine kinase [Nitratidesulfovibrio vulgaris]AAS94623.1 sensor histidine kinase [Nitratidesulfovibrio vulgaris str. Hildenborough]ADP85335.1 integral membrane sensor signal transduction histidine kinase [Nitratidesulfovibrio vulgaris RCH1]
MHAETAGAPRHRRTAVNRTIYAAILVASVMPIAIILGVMQVHLESTYSAIVRRGLREIADRHSQKVDDFLHERLASVQTLAMSQGALLLDPAQLASHLETLQRVHKGVYVDMGLVDAKGIQQVYAGPLDLRMADYSGKEWFREAVLRDSFISDVFMGIRQAPHFIVTTKVVLNGQPWILRSTIDFASFVSLVEDIRVGATGVACIINRQGEFQTAGNRHPLPEGTALAAQARRLFGPGFTARPTERVFEDGGNLYAMSLLKHGDWVLVVQEQREEALAALADAKQTLFAVLVLVSIGVIVGGVLLAWRIMDRLDEMEREMAALNAQVVEAGKLGALGEMAAGIAHEINNPVAIMMEEAGWIEDILADLGEGNPAAPEIARSAAQIRSQGKRCRDITHKLLSFARKSDRDLQRLDLNHLIRELVGLCDQRAASAGVTVSLALVDQLPAVLASPSEMQQVFLNLFNNAFDAMEGSGGALRVTSGVAAGNMVFVTVADTGPGIPEAILQRIYDPFFTTKPVGKGTGLGLSICYGIVKKLGGELRVNSLTGVGTSFQVLLPRAGEGVQAVERHD